jgi:hypothetical protein
MDELTRGDHQGWAMARAEGEVVVIPREIVARLGKQG